MDEVKKILRLSFFTACVIFLEGCERPSFVQPLRDIGEVTFHANCKCLALVGAKEGIEPYASYDGWQMSQECGTECLFTGHREFNYPNGQLNKRIQYRNGRPNGRYQQFRVTGERSVSGILKWGQRMGTWSYYCPDGVLAMQEKYSYRKGVRESTDLKISESDLALCDIQQAVEN